jgi:hypothetical protein
MTGQARLDIDQTHFILGGVPRYKTGTLAQDAERTEDLLQFTVLAYNPTTKKWLPYTDVEAVDGTHRPRGVYMGEDIAAATIVAGNVVLGKDQILVGGRGVFIDKNKLVFDDETLAIDDIITGVNYTELAAQVAQLVTDLNNHTHDDPVTGVTSKPKETSTVAITDAERSEIDVESALMQFGIYLRETVETASYENE